MQVSSISPNFQGRRDNIDALIGMDDNTVRQLAYLKTSAKVDHERNRKVTNTLFYSAPLAAGLGTALLTKNGNTRIFSTQLTGIAGRMAKGLKVAGYWTAGLMAIDLLGSVKNKLAQKSPEVRRFDNNHPILSLGTMILAGLGVLALVKKGAILASRVKAPKFVQNGTFKLAAFLNNNRISMKAKDGYKNILAKTPSALKEIGATALSWTPTALLFGGLFHSIGSANKERKEFAKNYTELKEKQMDASRAKVLELAMENDFLMQDAKNREDMKIMKDNLADLPYEVADKIDLVDAEEV